MYFNYLYYWMIFYIMLFCIRILLRFIIDSDNIVFIIYLILNYSYIYDVLSVNKIIEVYLFCFESFIFF